MKRSKYENPNKAFHEPLFLEFLSLYLGLELDCCKLSDKRVALKRLENEREKEKEKEMSPSESTHQQLMET